MEEEKKWYVVQTYSGHENRVVSGIRAMIKIHNLDEIEELKILTERVTVIKNGKKHETVRKTLPGYIFAKMNLNGKSWQAIRNVKGCVGFAGNNAKPVPLTKEETERFGIEEPARIEVPYKIGDSVQIIEGPLNGFFGKVKEIELEKEVISVMVSMFGRETPVELRIDDVEVII